jgi:hypothetical protein
VIPVPERDRCERLLEDEVGESGKVLKALLGARERFMRTIADAQSLHEAAQ